MSRKTPCFTHCWNRLWQVWYGGYLAGRSFQGAPVRKIHNIPSMTCGADLVQDGLAGLSMMRMQGALSDSDGI
jgi:hypothetical protein